MGVFRGGERYVTKPPQQGRRAIRRDRRGSPASSFNKSSNPVPAGNDILSRAQVGLLLGLGWGEFATLPNGTTRLAEWLCATSLLF
jgi:hypothetical protein